MVTPASTENNVSDPSHMDALTGCWIISAFSFTVSETLSEVRGGEQYAVTWTRYPNPFMAEIGLLTVRLGVPCPLYWAPDTEDHEVPLWTCQL